MADEIEKRLSGLQKLVKLNGKVINQLHQNFRLLYIANINGMAKISFIYNQES